MGLSIFYNGSMADPAMLPDLISEVSEIATTFGWRINLLGNEFPEKKFDNPGFHPESVYGLCVTPQGSEPVWLCFLSNGRMSAPHLLELWGSETDPERKEYLYMPWTKTQYAGIGEHIKVITLLRYLERKYLAGFQLTDEGEYWETNNPDVLKENFRKYDSVMDNFADFLDSADLKTGESLEEFVKRISGEVHKSFHEENGDTTPDID